ncbi:unnamed protein product, partial [Echinostoma caproni]|uniref:Mixed-lineage leukemia protein mll n=1 Tax=Echinostoma caproni TaxID=27848 RepID=A0A183AAM9_9TREM
QKAKSSRVVLGQSNTSTEIRRTRSSSRSGRVASSKRESSRTEKSTHIRKPPGQSKAETVAPVDPVQPKRAVTRRTRKTEPPKPVKTVDPYAFDLFACSDDEKENIDPKGEVGSKPRAILKCRKPVQPDPEKLRKAKTVLTKPSSSVFASPFAPLSGRPSVHFGVMKRIAVPPVPRKSTDLSLAEQERRKSASATILLSLPSSRPTVRDSSMFSVNSLTPTHMLSASTPANQVTGTGINDANKAMLPGPSTLFSPLIAAAPPLPATSPEVASLPDHHHLQTDEAVQTSATSSSRSLSEEKKNSSQSSHGSLAEDPEIMITGG